MRVLLFFLILITMHAHTDHAFDGRRRKEEEEGETSVYT